MSRYTGGNRMATVQALTSIGLIIVSFLIGFIFFYLTSPLTKQMKKHHMEEIISLIINYIIFIWIGKVLLNLPQFIRDPLAILAYPSNSSVFYIACLFIVLNVLYKMKRHKFQVKPFFVSFIPIFLVANFVYEFIQIIWFGNSWFYMALLMILIILYLLFFENMPQKITYGMILGWSFGQLLLGFINSYTTVFSYMLSPWFFITIIILTLIFMFNVNRKRVSS